jgi:hypothetical protein
MSPLLMVYLSAGTPFAGLGLLKLQARREHGITNGTERTAED